MQMSCARRILRGWNLYLDDQNQQIPLERLLSGQPPGTHVYVCGPRGMIDWVLATAERLGWPPEAVHSEEFLAPQSGKPFKVELAQSGKTITVGEHESLLEAMEREKALTPPYLCRGGACGQCGNPAVIAHDGTFQHHDHWLEDDERDGSKIMPCVSRFEGRPVWCWTGKGDGTMTIQFNDETFRDDYTFRNSEWAIKRFPFPFHEDSYMYSVNMERHRGGPDGSVYAKRFDVDEHYISEMRDLRAGLGG